MTGPMVMEQMALLSVAEERPLKRDVNTFFHDIIKFLNDDFWLDQLTTTVPKSMGIGTEDC